MKPVLLGYYIRKKSKYSYRVHNPLSYPLTQDNVDEISETLDCNLSPENLHEDGEISQNEAERKYQYYSRVIDELREYCNFHNLNAPRIDEYDPWMDDEA
tara:strand:- start:8745 stop:9044 length:300 start_codon:yes stop_codon:yes gene_type:complete